MVKEGLNSEFDVDAFCDIVQGIHEEKGTIDRIRMKLDLIMEDLFKDLDKNHHYYNIISSIAIMLDAGYITQLETILIKTVDLYGLIKEIEEE